MSPVYRTPNFEFHYEVKKGRTYLDFFVLNADEKSLVHNGDYSSGAELIQENFGFGAINPCFFDGTPLDLSEHIKKLEEAKTIDTMNKILMKIYWKLDSLEDSYC